jgi:hypothetical protein
MLDFRAAQVHARSDPPHAGTEHLSEAGKTLPELGQQSIGAAKFFASCRAQNSPGKWGNHAKMLASMMAL